MMSENEKALSSSNLLPGLNVRYLKIYGLWEGINTYRTEQKLSFRFSWLIWFSIISILPYIIFQFVCFFFVKMSVQMIIFVYMTGVPAFQILIKLAVFKYRFREHCALFDLIRVDFLTCIPEHKREKRDEIYGHVARKCNFYCALAFTLQIVVIGYWIIFPGEDASGVKKVMGGWYPLPYSESPWYEVVNSYETCLVLWHASMLTVYECILVQLSMGLYAQFSALSYHIATLKKEDLIHIDGCPVNLYLQKEFEAIMRDYDKLLSYGDLLKGVYNLLVTVMLGTGIVICVITNLHLLLTRNDLTFIIKFVLFFLYSAVEITLICLSSTLVETASTEIQFSLYSSDWYEADRKYKHSMQMMMVRASKPIGLVALKMYPVNMEIVIGIFRFIYSTGAVLSKMNEGVK